MKILLVTDLYPIKRGDNNSPTTLHNFAFEWIKQSHQVDVIKPNFLLNSFLRKKPFYKTGFYEYEGVKVFNVNYFSPFLFDIKNKLTVTGKKKPYPASCSLTPVFNTQAFDFKTYDIIIAHMPSGIIFAEKLAKKFNKPLVCGVHCSDIKVLTKPIYKHYFKTALLNGYKNAQKIACRSFVLQKKFNALYPDLADKTFVAASGINQETGNRKQETDVNDSAVAKSLCDEAIQQPLTAESLPKKDLSSPVKVLTCANLIKRKNIDKLILAVKELDGFELTIIGDGKELKKLKKLANVSLRPLREKVAESRMRGKNKIFFLGKLPHEKVIEEMKKSDIFVLPSVNETFGMVYLEAMASGCITVCTKDDGIDGIIIDEENGFLTLPTVEEIKETLQKIKTHKNLEQIRENSLKTIKKYTPEICAHNYLKNL